MQPHDFTDLRREHLTVLRRVENHPDRDEAQWLCRCDCGKEWVSLAGDISRGIRSCGRCAMRLASTVDGVTGNLRELAEHFGQPVGRVYNRVQHGWSVEDAIKTPPHPRGTPKRPPGRRKILTDNESIAIRKSRAAGESVRSLAAQYGVSDETIRRALGEE
jgi:hypothetical protein